MKNLHRNGIILVIAICFAAFGFVNEKAEAQSRNSASKTPTPKTKTSPTPSPKSAGKASTKPTPKPTPSPKASAKTTPKQTPEPKTSAKTAAKPTPAKPAANSKKDAKTENAKVKPTPTPAPKTKSSQTSKQTANAQKPSPKADAKIDLKSKTVKEDSKKNAAKPAAKVAAKEDSKKTVTQPKVVSKPAQTAATKSEPAGQIIVTGAIAQIRRQAAANSTLLSTVRLGRILPVEEANGNWYRVSYADGKSGWISKSAAKNFETSRREQIYLEIADKYSKNKKPDFETAFETVEFLKAAQTEVQKQDLQIDLRFKHLIALNSALRAIPFGKSEQNPYNNFLKANENEVVYSEPAGEWYVRSELFWELHGKSARLPIAEEIAWEASQNPIPGECEGYINCYLYIIRATDGEYLNFYPNGKYAKNALTNITNYLEPIVSDITEKAVYTPPSDMSDRAEFNRFLTELRTIISKLPDVEKAQTLGQINKIGEAYK